MYSKKKLDRLTISAGNFGRAGEREGGNLTLKRLKDLLEDDVKNLSRMTAGADVSTAAILTDGPTTADGQREISDAELDVMLNRSSFIKKTSGVNGDVEEYISSIPREGDMYDVVSAADNSPTLQGLF